VAGVHREGLGEVLQVCMMEGMGWYQSNGAFPTTDWVAVREVGGAEGAERLASLVDAYWPAAYAYLRRRGLDRERAAELTQGFFADVVLSRGLFSSADEARGRLRSLIVAALTNYVMDMGRRERSRGGGRLRSLDQAWLDREDRLLEREPGGAEEAFDRRWSLAVLEEALRRCERHYVDTGKRGHWAVFESRVLRPVVGSVAPGALDELARAHGFASPADVSAAVQVVKRRLSGLMREVAAESGAVELDLARWLPGGA
jgi:DNA-directed RNA polymerase specialized sigma24 family protein